MGGGRQEKTGSLFEFSLELLHAFRHGLVQIHDQITLFGHDLYRFSCHGSPPLWLVRLFLRSGVGFPK